MLRYRYRCCTGALAMNVVVPLWRAVRVGRVGKDKGKLSEVESGGVDRLTS